MSVSAEQVEQFFKSGGQDEAVVTKLRETIPESTPEPTPDEPKVDAKPEIKQDKPAEKPEDKPIPEARFVPLEALQEERAEKKQLKQEIEQFRAWQQQVSERLQAIPKAQAEQAPDPNTDPFGYQAWALQQLGSTVQDVQAWREQQEQEQRQQAEIRNLASWANTQEREFAKANPDYPKAYQHMVDLRTRQLSVAGYSPEQVQAQLRYDQLGVIQQARALGRNPADLIWAMAHESGFSKAETKVSDPKAADKIAAGLSQAPKLDKGGSSADGPLSYQDLAKIEDPEEFEKQWKKVFGKK